MYVCVVTKINTSSILNLFMINLLLGLAVAVLNSDSVLLICKPEVYQHFITENYVVLSFKAFSKLNSVSTNIVFRAVITS